MKPQHILGAIAAVGILAIWATCYACAHWLFTGYFWMTQGELK